MFLLGLYTSALCSREDVGELAWSTHRHHLYGCQRPPVLAGIWDIKVLTWISTGLVHSPLTPVNPMAPARKAEVAPDQLEKKKLVPFLRPAPIGPGSHMRNL